MTNVMETPQEQRSGRRTVLSIGIVVGVVVTIGVVALIAQNTNDATVRWLTLDGQQPLWAVLAITAIAGAVLAKLFGFVWRHRNHKS